MTALEVASPAPVLDRRRTGLSGPVSGAARPSLPRFGFARYATDIFGFRHGTGSGAAIGAFEEAVHAVLAHRPGVLGALDRAEALAPDLAAAAALRGFANLLLGRAAFLPDARAAAETACGLIGRHASADERALAESLDLAVGGRFGKAAARLDAALDLNPGNVLAAKIGHALRFMIGDAHGMLVATTRILGRVDAARRSYGYLLGCHAFALEELGEFRAAEATGRQAVVIAPDDAWGLHAVGHVHEMQGRVAEGIAWLDHSRPVWRGCNNFAFHMAWHLALFHLERGEHARVLALYDEEVRPDSSEDFRDVANAVSLLWRLGQEGVAVGARWEELRGIALRQQHDTTLAFATLHTMLALVATGEIGAARDCLGRMAGSAQPAGGEQVVLLHGVAQDLGEALLALAGDRGSRPRLDRLAARLNSLGGSNAQRDVFMRALANLAAQRGDSGMLASVLSLRHRLKNRDRFAAALVARCETIACSGSRRLAKRPLSHRHTIEGV